MSFDLLKGLRYVGYPDDCLMLADGTVICEFSTGRARLDRAVKDSIGKAISEAVNGFFLADNGVGEGSPDVQPIEAVVKRGRGRPRKVLA